MNSHNYDCVNAMSFEEERTNQSEIQSAMQRKKNYTYLFETSLTYNVYVMYKLLFDKHTRKSEFGEGGVRGRGSCVLLVLSKSINIVTM